MRALISLLVCSVLNAQLLVPIVGQSPAALSFTFTGGSLPAGITFTRSSSGTYLDNSAVLQTASTNVARFNYISGTPYLLIEPAATNLIPESNTFSSGSWFSTGSAVQTAAQFTSVDGTNDGWSLTSGSGFGARLYPLTLSAIPYALSGWSKRITGTAAANMVIGASTSPLTTSSTLTRFSFTATPAGGSTNVGIGVNAATGNTNGLFGEQLETGAVATSYIVTSGGTASRSADVATFTIPAGIGHLTYTFDDNSTQVVSVSPGSYTIPTNLNRPNLKSVVGSA